MQHGEEARPAEDHRWSKDVYASARCAGVLLALLLLIDWGAGTVSWWRGTLWTTVALLLFAALSPARVRAGDGWLTSRRLLRTRRVRTDLLVSVRCLDGISPRLLLRDSSGDRLRIDPQVLIDNPGLWRYVDEGARRSAAAGTLLCGATALSRLAERVEHENALGVFKASGLE
ncbi:hypothetical protein AB0N16_39955 [Streptomyces sp. NPDC051105]|uniref:hypothetical protein n=1 Tax=Streptomyces sp. NPDC051105 TaxID=3154843 RepID=UPI003438D0AF